MEGQGPAGIDVRRYFTVVRRHILLIAVLTIALGVAAYAYSASKTPMYEAIGSASVCTAAQRQRPAEHELH